MSNDPHSPRGWVWGWPAASTSICIRNRCRLRRGLRRLRLIIRGVGSTWRSLSSGGVTVFWEHRDPRNLREHLTVRIITII